MRARLAGLAIAACVLAGLTGCGGDDGDGDGDRGYPAAAKRNFTTACERSSGGDAEGCRCAFDKIQTRLSYEQFKREDAALRRGAKPSRIVTDAVAACAKR